MNLFLNVSGIGMGAHETSGQFHAVHAAIAFAVETRASIDNSSVWPVVWNEIASIYIDKEMHKRISLLSDMRGSERSGDVL